MKKSRKPMGTEEVVEKQPTMMESPSRQTLPSPLLRFPYRALVGFTHTTLIALALLTGCSCEREPAPVVEKPTVKPGTDELGLPLVIHIDVPDVPEEIRGPSPPILPKKPAPKKPSKSTQKP
jgi:hypothetical protein